MYCSAEPLVKPAEVHALAVAEGLNHGAAIIATAIAWAESNLDPSAVGDVDLQDNYWGPSVGLWQVRSMRAHTGTGKPRDIERLGDPAFNAHAMFVISSEGEDWTPWSVFKNGRYLRHLDDVRTAIAAPDGHAMRFVSRSEWGARSRTGASGAPDMTRGVGVHWLGPGSSRPDHAQCAAQMREVQAFHMGLERGWADFAYNAAACRHGYLFEGRGPKVRNAANGGGTRAGVDANAGWASILYLEGTDGPGLTPEGQDAINDAAEWLGVADGEWLGHRDFLSTECPGDRIYGWVHSGHPRSTGSTPDPHPQGDPRMLTFRYVFDGLDWVFDGSSGLFFQCDDTAQITEVLDPLGVKSLGKVSPATHRRYSELAKSAGFAG